MTDRGSRKALEWIQWLPGHPVREELEFQAWAAEHPFPWPAPKTNHRLCIATSELVAENEVWLVGPNRIDKIINVGWEEDTD